jgi:hypothetical protein
LGRAAAQTFFIVGEIYEMSKMEIINPNESRYSETETMRKLDVRNRLTLWRWRRRGLIGFYRIGNRIYYGDSHIRAFLARCEHKARVKEVV